MQPLSSNSSTGSISRLHPTEVGARLLEIRRDARLSRSQVEAATGVPGGTLAKYELGESLPGAAALAALCRGYGVSSDYVLGLDPSRDGIVIEIPRHLTDAFTEKLGEFAADNGGD